MTTYKVTWFCGASRCYHRKKLALEVFNVSRCPDCEECKSAETLSKIKLTADAFERSYNGQGAYEESETILKQNPK
jgi:hypothetical protein